MKHTFNNQRHNALMSNAIFTVTWYLLLARKSPACISLFLLLWRHNGCDSVLNHQPHDCLLNRLSRRRSKKTSKLHVTGLCAGNSPGTSNAENVFIWWRHHVSLFRVFDTEWQWKSNRSLKMSFGLSMAPRTKHNKDSMTKIGSVLRRDVLGKIMISTNMQSLWNQWLSVRKT